MNNRVEWQRPQVDFKNTNHFNHLFNKVLKYWGLVIATQMTRIFVDYAARFTPPNMGKANIEEKYYYRPIQELAKLAKGEYPPYHATKADYAALREGFKFRVLNTKVGHKRNEVYAYCKGINEAKRVSRIQNRGLARYTWGDALINQAEKVYTVENQGNIKIVETQLPPIFHRLVKKSPNISKLHFGFARSSYVRGKNAYFEVEVVNKLAESERYSTIAVEKGTVAVDSWTKKFFGKIKEGLEKDVKKLLEDAKIYRVYLKK